MDYDDNDAQDQNFHLTGEGSSKVSPVSHSYPLPKFDFDDNLQEHLRFDSLVENEVFLGITSQEDNQWIEEYSRETSAIPFNTSVAESKNQNVWSEATSSESVEMLLKSVGQEEKGLEETMIEELDPNLKQYDGNDPNEFQENCEQSHVTFTSQSQETQVSHGGLDDAVVGDKFGLSFGEKKVDKICDDANQEGSNLAKEMQEDPSVFKVECGNTGSLQNVDAIDLSENLNSSEAEHIDKICDDANQKGCDLANEYVIIELQEDPSVSKAECGNEDFSQHSDASVKVLETHKENANDHSKNFHSSEPELIDNICDDANEEDGNLENESFANEWQEDLSVSKVEGGSAGSSQNVDASVEECQENPKEVLETPNENRSDLSKNSNKIRNNVTGDDNILANKSSVNELQEDSSVCKVEDASIEKFKETECANDLSKSFHSSEPEVVDKLCDDANQKGSDLGNESFVNDVQDLSVSMVECENAKSSQNMDANIEEYQDNPQGVLETVNENATDLNLYNSEPKHIDKKSDDENKEYCNLASETQPLEPDVASMDQDFTFNGRGDAKDPSDVKNVAIDVVGAFDSQKNVEPSSSGNNASNIATEDLKSSPVKIPGVDQVGYETQSSEPDAVSMDQDFTVSERGDTPTTLPLDLKDMDMDVDRLPDSQKTVEPSLSAEGYEAAIVTAQGSEPNMAVLPDAVADVESSKILSPDTQEADIVTEDQPRSPILGVSLLHNNNKEKTEIELSSEGSCQKGTPEMDSVAKNDIDTEDQPISPILGVSLQDVNKEKVEIGGSCQKGTSEVDSGPLLVVKKDADSHGDLPVESCDVGPSEQTADDNPGGLKGSKPLETSSLPCDTSEEADNGDARGLLDPKKAISGEDGVEPLSLTVNISNEQLASAVVAGSSERENEGGSASLDKPRNFSFSDTKSIEPAEGEKGKHEVTKGTMENIPLLEISNEGDGLRSISLISATKEEKSFTFEVTGQIGIQNLDFSKVSSVSSSGGLLDSNKSHNNSSLVTPQTPSVAPSDSGPKKTSERKPRRKSVGKETAKKGNRSKETTPTRHSRTDKSPALITSENQPDLNSSNSILQQSFTDTQQVQLRAQILVYGSLISGMSPEEPHMIAAFGQSDSGRKAWEAAWHACIERVHGHGHGQKSQVNNPQTPLQETKIDSSQSKILSTPTITGPIVTPMTPIPSPLWNITTPHDRLQSSATPRSALFDYRQTASPLQSFQTQRVQTFSAHNPSWPSQGPLPGQWVASSQVSPFSARFSSLPITESVKLTTVKESGTPGTSVSPVQHITGPIISPAQPSNDSKSRKRKKVDLSQTSVPSPTPVAFTTPKTNPFLLPLSPRPTYSQPRPVDRNMEKTVTKEEIMSKIEESKLQATEAAEHAAVAVTHCQDVWSQLERQKSSNLVSDDEAKLTSSAVSIAAAASVAKVAAYAAKIASNVAEQAGLMADEVFLLSQPESQKATPASVLKSDHSTSVISVAREAARRRIEAASAASKHAENLDAIVKAAELAAEAVSQAGKIVAMGKPLPISELVEAGPEGYWKTPQAFNKQSYSGNKQKVEGESSDKKIQILKHGLSLQEDSGVITKKQIMITREENDKSTVRVCEDSDLSKTIGAVPELEVGPSYMSNADVAMPQSASPTWKDNITEGCLVEVYKDDNKNKGAWFAANVLTLKDGKAFVCYTEIQSDEGKLKEWVPFEVEGTEAPRIRIAHPMTIVRFEGTKKRGRTVFSDYAWSSGDQVDVWVQDSWHEAIVVETNKIDVTSLTVQFPAQGKTSVVRSWHVRPTLIWKDDKWIEWSSLKGKRSSEGDTPQGKRHKFDIEKEKSISVDLETWRHQESRLPTLSTQGTTFDVGKTSRVDENKQKTHGPMRSGIQKERSRVVFGVPKPGKKQKFMDVSRHYDGDGSNKSNTPNNSVKKFFINDSKEKQAAEVNSKALKFRKPPIPAVVRMLAQKDKAKSSVSDKNVKDSGSVDENLPGQQKEMGVGSSSNDVSSKTPKQSSKSKVVVSERLNKRKLPSGNGKATKVEVKDNSTSEAEPRRSNRKIQPTSRLLEGLQSSLTISKMPTVSHSSQRSHNKVMPKGSPKLG